MLHHYFNLQDLSQQWPNFAENNSHNVINLSDSLLKLSQLLDVLNLNHQRQVDNFNMGLIN